MCQRIDISCFPPILYPSPPPHCFLTEQNKQSYVSDGGEEGPLCTLSLASKMLLKGVVLVQAVNFCNLWIPLMNRLEPCPGEVGPCHSNPWRKLCLQDLRGRRGLEWPDSLCIFYWDKGIKHESWRREKYIIMICSITFAFGKERLCIELCSGRECVTERENAWEMNEEKRKGTWGRGQGVESFRVLGTELLPGAWPALLFTSSLSATALHVTEGGHEVQVDVMILGYENTEEIIAVFKTWDNCLQ